MVFGSRVLVWLEWGCIVGWGVEWSFPLFRFGGDNLGGGEKGRFGG